MPGTYHRWTSLTDYPDWETRNEMSLNVILSVAALAAFAACVNGFLGAGVLLFLWMVLLGMVRQRVGMPGGEVAEITQYTWAPHLLLPVVLFLILWQWKLRGRIGPQFGLRDIVRRRRSDSFA
ncbi:MAG: hypothetical protein ACRDI2_12145 [Chloroflexota bacterium]